MNETLQKIAESLYNGAAPEVARLVQHALDSGIPPDEILSAGLIVGMDRVGADFKVGELFVPEVLVAARAMHAGMDILRPLLAASDKMIGKYLIGTVQGDLHDIGKNLVRMMMEGAGFDVVDLGTDVDPETFVSAVREHQPDVVGMSALLTTTMIKMKATIAALQAAGLRQEVKIMIGGAPVTEAFAEEIGADAYAPDAATAAEIARTFVGSRRGG
jgi:5-methyltetrahydrofolate--homocysteine methyltransferase